MTKIEALKLLRDNLAGMGWGLILGIVFTSFKQPIFASWQYWLLLIYPIVAFTLTAER